MADQTDTETAEQERAGGWDRGGGFWNLNKPTTRHRPLTAPRDSLAHVAIHFSLIARRMPNRHDRNSASSAKKKSTTGLQTWVGPELAGAFVFLETVENGVEARAGRGS